MTQVFQTVHPRSDLNDLWSRQHPAKNLAELRAAIVAQYGPFPLLFDVPASEKWAGQGPGIVITGLEHFPGADERTEMPFLGAVAVGYLPALGHGGLTMQNLNKIVTPAFFENTRVAPPVNPRQGSRPDLIGKAEEMPETAMTAAQIEHQP